MFIIRRVVERDLTPVRQLLREAQLNDQGVEDHLEHFFVVEYPGEKKEDQALVGAVGMEVYKPYGLLRSFVLERSSWNLKIGLQMIQILLSYAGHLKLSHVYLLAGASLPFFEQMGFTAISLDELPEEIRASPHLEHTVSQGTPMVYICFPTQQH
jgi:N-acetylglutamate synthase-like GNAT family acetyltransferase